MAKIDIPKLSGERSKVREMSVKSQGILKTILSGNPGQLPSAKQMIKEAHIRRSQFLNKNTQVWGAHRQTEEPVFQWLWSRLT